jgi:hypothetical protein
LPGGHRQCALDGHGKGHQDNEDEAGQILHSSAMLPSDLTLINRRCPRFLNEWLFC